eukprot:COSAG06_NODE_7909_length_2336_cov_1.483236_3_plen_104_part_00
MHTVGGNSKPTPDTIWNLLAAVAAVVRPRRSRPLTHAQDEQPHRHMLEAVSGALYSFARGVGIYLAVTLTVSSPVIVYYFTKGAFTAPVEHWEPARAEKRRIA